MIKILKSTSGKQFIEVKGSLWICNQKPEKNESVKEHETRVINSFKERRDSFQRLC